MRELWQEIKWFLRQKGYLFALTLTAVCGYGFEITHPSIGIDDTEVALYVADGLNVERGRWVMYLLNKVFYFGEFAPFMTEVIGVLFLMLTAVLLCVLLRRLLGERAGIVPCTLFSCVFVSNPLISMVFVYYYHNGVGLGYVFTALALLCYHDGLSKKGRERLWPFVGSTACIWAAAGCYESFLIVYILGVLVLLFLQGIFKNVKLNIGYVLSSLGIGAASVVGSMILRSVTAAMLLAVFHIHTEDAVEVRGLAEMMVLFRGREGLSDLFMLIKRFLVVYHLNALVYLPITGYEAACICAGAYAVIMGIRRRNLWYPLLFAGMLIAPFLLVVAEAKVTFYRSCQYLPFFTAVGALLLYLAFDKWKYSRYWKWAAAFMGIVLIYNQATMLNRNFYIDYREYELARETLTDAVHDARQQYGNDMPIVFVGQYEFPFEFMKDYYVSYDSWQYKCIAAVTDLVDVHLKEKYHQPEGYCFIGEMNLPMIRWGFEVFDGTNRELIRFLEMHGYQVTTISDPEELQRARDMSESLPRWPQTGSIIMRDGYILINL